MHFTSAKLAFSGKTHKLNQQTRTLNQRTVNSVKHISDLFLLCQIVYNSQINLAFCSLIRTFAARNAFIIMKPLKILNTV